MTVGRALGAGLLAALVLQPLIPLGGYRQYVLHVTIQVFIWSFIGSAWSLMGRFGLVSLGHGAFLGMGAYTSVLLWNFFGVSPWLGALAGVAAAVGIAVVIGIPCFRYQVIGHYFGLVTLAVGEVIRLLIIAERDWTAGSLGLTLKAAGGDSLWALQYANKQVFYYASLAVLLAGLWVWHRLDRSMLRSALEAIGEDETAAASVGIRVTRLKLGVTVLSAAVLGGMYSLLGPLVGTALTTALAEGLRIAFGLKFLGMADTIYGFLLVVFIIFLPSGIYGSLREAFRRRASPPAPGPAVPAKTTA